MKKLVIIDGLRSPIGKFSSLIKDEVDDFSSSLLRKFLQKNNLSSEITELIIGNAGQPPHAANIARVIGLKAGLSKSIPAYTVHRNCASGTESLTSAFYKIMHSPKECILVGGIESMSNYPFLFSHKMKDFLFNLQLKKSFLKKLIHFFSFRFSFLSPIMSLKLGLTDTTCNMLMGETAEKLAKIFHITREEQDQFALESHNKAEKALKSGRFKEESTFMLADRKNGNFIENDNGIRFSQSLEALAKLRPFFQKKNGTVTAGNSSQISDGAAFLLASSEEKVQELNIKPLGYLIDFVYVGLEPSIMGLGPAFAIQKLLEKTQLTLKDIDLFEINEAFACQVIACLKALNSKTFCQENFALKIPIGKIPQEKLNVNGGAIALGHPVGMTGTRLILTMLKELQKRKLKRGIVSLCIGGGQGVALLLESGL